MKTKSFKLILLSLLTIGLLQSACKIPELQISYTHLVREQINYQQNRNQEEPPQPLPEDVCLHIYEGYYAYCAKLKPEERILEPTLALDNHCQDTVMGYHRFSLIEVARHEPVERIERVLFVSFSQLENELPEQSQEPVRLLRGGQSESDTIKIRGAVTMYSGEYLNDTTIYFNKRFIYTVPPKISLFSRGGRLQKETAVSLRLIISKSPEQSRPAVYLKGMINYGRNELSDSKPLVFSLSEVFNIDSLALPYYLAECSIGK